MRPDKAAATVSPRTVTGSSGNIPGHGPFLTLTLVIREGRVCEASYETYQCPGTHSCGKALCALVTGKSLEEARAVRHEDVARLVGPLPANRRISYGLALLALADALAKLD